MLCAGPSGRTAQQQGNRAGREHHLRVRRTRQRIGGQDLQLNAAQLQPWAGTAAGPSYGGPVIAVHHTTWQAAGVVGGSGAHSGAGVVPAPAAAAAGGAEGAWSAPHINFTMGWFEPSQEQRRKRPKVRRQR